MILGLLLIVVGFVLVRWKWMQIIANYISLSADKKVQYDVEKLSVLFRNVMLFMGLMMIIGEVLATYMVLEIINPVFLWSALVIGISYFVLKANSVEYRLIY